VGQKIPVGRVEMLKLTPVASGGNTESERLYGILDRQIGKTPSMPSLKTVS